MAILVPRETPAWRRPAASRSARSRISAKVSTRSFTTTARLRGYALAARCRAAITVSAVLIASRREMAGQPQSDLWKREYQRQDQELAEHERQRPADDGRQRNVRSDLTRNEQVHADRGVITASSACRTTSTPNQIGSTPAP